MTGTTQRRIAAAVVAGVAASGVALTGVAAPAPAAGAAAPYAATTRLISGDGKGRPVAPPSSLITAVFATAVSADGRWVVFSTTGAILPGVVPGEVNVYLRDVRAGRTTRLSTGKVAEPDGIVRVTVSASGRYVAWPEAGRTTLLDRRTGTRRTLPVHEIDLSGTREGLALVRHHGPALAPGRAPTSKDVAQTYLYDIARNTFRWAVPGVAGRDTGEYRAYLTPDQRQVVALTTRTVLADRQGGGLFVRSVAGTAWKRLRRPPVTRHEHLGAPTLGARHVVITTTKALVKADKNRVGDIYRWDTRTGAAVLVSVTNSGKPCVPAAFPPVLGPSGSYGPQISADGVVVAFYSTCKNFIANALLTLAVRDIARRTTHKVNLLPRSGTSTGLINTWGLVHPFALSADGRWAAWLDQDRRVIGLPAPPPTLQPVPETYLRGPLR